jgi:hypothetical protein
MRGKNKESRSVNQKSARLKAAWTKFASDAARLTEFLAAKRKRG